MPRATSVSNANNRAAVRAALSGLRKAAGSWRGVSDAIAESAGVVINPGYLNAIANKRRPPSEQVLRALGLDVPVLVEVPAGFGVAELCPSCGNPHTHKRCPEKRKARAIVRVRVSGSQRRGVRYGHGEGRQQDRI